MNPTTLPIITAPSNIAPARPVRRITKGKVLLALFGIAVAMVGNIALRIHGPDCATEVVNQLRADEDFVAKYGRPERLRGGNVFAVTDGFSGSTTYGILTTARVFSAEIETSRGTVPVIVDATGALGMWLIDVTPAQSRFIANKHARP